MAKAGNPFEAPPETARRDTGGNRSVIWFSGLACGALVVIAPGIAALALGLLAPGALAVRLDHEPGRPIARSVVTFGLAGCVHPVILLWNMGQSFDTAIAILMDPTTLAVAWAAAGAGWLLTQMAPLAVRAVLEAAALTRSVRLRAERTRLAETWGLDAASDDR
jgi:hypothetical protein